MHNPNLTSSPNEHALLERAIGALEASRSSVGEETADVAMALLREKLSGGVVRRIAQQRKPVTALFADVSGFTAMSETMDHEIVNDVINSLWSRVDKAIHDHGGRIDKHIGDAIMALYGAPTEREDDSERAIRSGLQIQSEILEWKREQSEKLPDYKTQIQNIQLRIGINTGLALLGSVGTTGEYTAIGESVILANKLESAAPKGGILISQEVYKHARGLFDVTVHEPITVKGRSEPTQVYTVNGVNANINAETTGSTVDPRREFRQAIDGLEIKRSLLGDDIVNVAIECVQEKLAWLVGGRRAEHVPQQRKLVTILFADVSGFNAMFETMEEEIVADVIESMWSRVDKAIQEQSGRVDKHIFDVVMGLYGIPTAHEDDPERAIRSALQIQAEILDWKRLESNRLPDYKAQIENIQLRIGINTGPALLGTVGTVGEFTAIGDTVNLAQRLEANAPNGGILISHETHQLVRGIFEVTALAPITVKGKREPIQVYTVNGVRPRSFRDTTRGLEGVETRTIGRDAELLQMQAAFRDAVSGQTTHLISLVGEAGIGKSRLLFEFGKWLEAHESHARLLKSRAGQETAQIPYSLLRGLLSSLYDIQEMDQAAVARQKLESGILNSTVNAENAERYAPFIGHLIGFDYSTDPHIKGILGDAKQIRDLAFHYGGQLIAEMAQVQPIVILLEDIHWADSGSLDFFEHLMSQHPELPLLVVGLMRSTFFEQRSDWGTGPVRALSMNLLPLSDADTRLLIQEILQKIPEIPEEIIDLIVKKAEGSPFYVEELIRVLIEGDVIVRGQEQWSVQLDRLSDLKVPATLTGLLQARLDVLESETRETLQQASVVGRVFWTEIVEHMHNPEIPASKHKEPISEELRILHAKELVYQYHEANVQQAIEFIFKNQILHDVTYESVLLRFRPVYHFQAAEGLVEVGGERANEFAGRVGEHYERAGAWIKAAEWYVRAGRQAQNTYAPDLAINFLQKALGFIKTYGGENQDQLKLEAYQRLGMVLNWQARYPEAIEVYTAMLAEAEQISDPLAQSRALHGLAFSLNYQGDNPASLENAIRAEALARSANENFEIAQSLWDQSFARYRLGEAQLALPLAEKALAIFTDLGDTVQIARCLNLLAGLNYVSGRLNEAESYWGKALKLFQDLGNHMLSTDVLANLGALADARGDYEMALTRFDNAVKFCRETGYKDGEIVFLSNRGWELNALGRYEEAIHDLEEAIGRAGINGSWVMPQAFNSHAEALIGLGRYEEAFYSARQSLVFAEEDNALEPVGMAWRTLGVICDKTDNPVEFSDWETHQKRTYDADTCFSRSVKVFTEAEIEMERARTLRAWARYELKRGNKESGEKKWQEARQVFANLGAQLDADRMTELPG